MKFLGRITGRWISWAERCRRIPSPFSPVETLWLVYPNGVLPTPWLEALRLTDPPRSEWVADAIALCPHVPDQTKIAFAQRLVGKPSTVGSVFDAVESLELDSQDHFCAGPSATCEPRLTKISQLDDVLTRAWWGDEYPSGVQNAAAQAFRDLASGDLVAPTSGTVGRPEKHRSFAGFQADLDPADDLQMQMNRAGLELQNGYNGYWVRASYPSAGCADITVPTVIDAGAYPPFLPSGVNALTGTTRPLNGAARSMREIVHRPIDCVSHGVTVSVAGQFP